VGADGVDDCLDAGRSLPVPVRHKIIGHILDVARAPDDPPVFQANRRWRVHGQRDDVGITVIVQPDGRIWSAWPDADSPGVVKNPRETQ
jgi:hypothetical protein